MPCNTRITNTVELNQKTDAKLMAKALAKRFQGSRVVDAERGRFQFSSEGATVYLVDGQLQSQSLSEQSLGVVAGKVKQAYAEQALLAASQRFGWAAKEQATTNVTRRS